MQKLFKMMMISTLVLMVGCPKDKNQQALVCEQADDVRLAMQSIEATLEAFVSSNGDENEIIGPELMQLLSEAVVGDRPSLEYSLNEIHCENIFPMGLIPEQIRDEYGVAIESTVEMRQRHAMYDDCLTGDYSQIGGEEPYFPVLLADYAIKITTEHLSTTEVAEEDEDCGQWEIQADDNGVNRPVYIECAEVEIVTPNHPDQIIENLIDIKTRLSNRENLSVEDAQWVLGLINLLRENDINVLTEQGCNNTTLALILQGIIGYPSGNPAMNQDKIDERPIPSSLEEILGTSSQAVTI